MNTTSSLKTGTTFARFACSLTAGKGDVMSAESYASAKGWHGTAQVCKALIAPQSTADIGDAMNPISNDLVEFLRPLTIIGRMQGLRRAPFRTRILLQNIGGGGAWVSNGSPIPVSALGFDAAVNLEILKVGAIRVLTAELVRAAVAGAFELVANDAVSSLVLELDAAFVNPDNSGLPGERPASISFGAPQFVSSGVTVGAIDADLQKLVASLIANDMPLSTAAWIVHPRTAVYLSSLRGSGDAPAYPGVTARGGILLGLPVITSSAITQASSPTETFIVLAEANEILLADDSQASLELSTQGSLQLDDAPAGGAQQQTSLWQSNLVGLKTIRYVNWARRRPSLRRLHRFSSSVRRRVHGFSVFSVTQPG